MLLLKRSVILTITLLAASHISGQKYDEDKDAQEDEYSRYFEAAQAFAETVHRPVVFFGSEGQASQPQANYVPAEYFSASGGSPLKDFLDTVHEQTSTRHRRSQYGRPSRSEPKPRKKKKKSNYDDEEIPSFDYRKSIEKESQESRKMAEVGSEKYRPYDFNYDKDESASAIEPKYREVTRQPYNSDYERAVHDIQSSGSEYVPQEIKQSDCRPVNSPENKPDMNCFVCETPGTKSKFTQCSYAAKRDPVKYYKENSEKFSMDHLPLSDPQRNKRYADKSDPYDLVRQRTQKSFEEAGHPHDYSMGFEYEPETYEETKGELSYSEMQAEKIKKNPENCQKVEREGMTCTVCKDKASGGNYESCSYTSTPTEKKYAYVKEKKYDSDQPEDEKENQQTKTVELTEESKQQAQSAEKPKRHKDREHIEEQSRSKQSKNPKKRNNLEGTQTQVGNQQPAQVASTENNQAQQEEVTQTVRYEEPKEVETQQQDNEPTQTPETLHAAHFNSHPNNDKEHTAYDHTHQIPSDPQVHAFIHSAHKPGDGHFESPDGKQEPNLQDHQYHKHHEHKSEPDHYEHQHHQHAHHQHPHHQHPQKHQHKHEATKDAYHDNVHKKEDRVGNYDIPKHFSETVRHGANADHDHHDDSDHDHHHEEEAETKEKKEGDTADFDTYHYKLFPEIAKEETKNKEREEEYDKDYSHIPTATKQNVEDVLAEFTKKDRSKCKKAEKNGMTCYLCVDKNNIQHEECMYVQESQPKSSHVAYHGVKKKKPEEIEKEKREQERLAKKQKEAGDEYHEHPDGQASAQSSEPEMAVAASDMDMVVAASEVDDTVIRYDEMTGERIPSENRGRVRKRKRQYKKVPPNSDKKPQPQKQQQEENTNGEPTLKTPEEFTVGNEEGAFSAETKPVYSKMHGVQLPRYLQTG